MNERIQKPVERVLVLSGGGARGAYQVGVCQVLAQKGWTPDAIVGNSIGATNGAILAAPASGEDTFRSAVDLLRRVWRTEMKNRKLYEPSDEWPPLLGKTIYWAIRLLQVLEKAPPAPGGPGPEETDLLDRLRDAILDEYLSVEELPGREALRGFLDRIRDELREGLSKPSLIEREQWARVLEQNVDWGRLNADEARCCLGCIATDAETGTPAWFWNRVPPELSDRYPQTGLSVRHVMASSSIWSIYPSTRVDGRDYWDGALLANTPVEPAIDLILARGEDEPALDVVVVLMTPYFEKPPGLKAHDPPSVLDGLARFLDWMMLGTFRAQLARLNAAQRKRVRIVQPGAFQGVVQMIDYTPREIKALRKQGKADAEQHLG